jgi:hypothetical protein
MSTEIKKISIIGSIEVLPSGHIQVRRDDQVLEGDEVLSNKPHRHVLAPGDDLTGQDPRVVAEAQAAWAELPADKG